MTRLAVVITVALLAGAAFAADAPDPAKALATLLAQDDPAGSMKHIAAVVEACSDDISKVRQLIASDVDYDRFKLGWHWRSEKVSEGKTIHDVKFLVRIPKGYTPEKTWPLLVAAHGQFGSAKSVAGLMEYLRGADREKYLVVAPSMPGPQIYNAKAYQEQVYLKPMMWAKRKLNVDDDRVYISGYSQGGHVSWHMGVMFPRFFAAAVPMAGVPAFEGAPFTCTIYLENISNLPLWAIWGEKDVAPGDAQGNVDVCRQAAKRLDELGNTRFKGTELPGKGHLGCFPDPEEFSKYLAANKRVVVPERFEHLFHVKRHSRGYYLEATRLSGKALDFSKRIRVITHGREPTKEDLKKAFEKKFQVKLYRMSGVLDRAENSLTIESKRVRTMRIYVMDGMFDLSKEVTVKFANRKWRGRIRPSAKCMISHYAASRDQTALVLNELIFSTNAPKPSIRYR